MAMIAPRIELIARRQEDLQNGNPDYHVFAGVRLVGRIYKTHMHAVDQWFWGLNGVWSSAEIGIALHGNAIGFEESKTRLRAAFDAWLPWILRIGPEHPSYAAIRTQLKEIGAVTEAGIERSSPQQ